MMSFRGGRLGEFTPPDDHVKLISEITEANERLREFTRRAPHIHAAMRQTAMRQSAESSSRIGGVTVAPERAHPVIIGNVPPKDRFEEEIQGYRRAFSLIHTSAAYFPVTPDNLRKFHKILQAGSLDAGEWKRTTGDVTQIRKRTLDPSEFRPLSPDRVAAAIEELCECYRLAVGPQRVTPLVASACLVLDFRCIHPFSDGNGRVARLLSLLTLYQIGLEIGGCISIERLIEDTRDEYYQVLKVSSGGWHEGKHDLVPWLGYYLEIIRKAYREFERLTSDETPE